MEETYTREQVGLLIQQLDAANKARVAFQATDRPFTVQKITLDLSVARPRTTALRIGAQFRSLYVEAASDVFTNARLVLGSNESYQSDVPLAYNAALELDYPCAEAYIFWDTAQPGKTMTIDFFISAAYRSGSQISYTAGGMSISDGSVIVGPTRVTLAATAATIIAPADLTRKKATIQNKTGADLYVGGSTIGAVGGANEGIKVAPDGIIVWSNTAALYGWSVLGGNVHRLEEA